MDFEKFFKVAKVLLVVPILVGLLTLVEQFLPLQTLHEVVDYKKVTSGKFGNETHSIDFNTVNDQFTEEIYNQATEGSDVTLKVTYFTKEVKEIQLSADGAFLPNDTNEIYFQLGFALVFLIFGIYFIRKQYYTNKQYKYIAILLFISIGNLIRLLSLHI